MMRMSYCLCNDPCWCSSLKESISRFMDKVFRDAINHPPWSSSCSRFFITLLPWYGAEMFWWELTIMLQRLTSTGRVEFFLSHCWSCQNTCVTGNWSTLCLWELYISQVWRTGAYLTSRASCLLDKWRTHPLVEKEVWARLGSFLRWWKEWS